MSTALTTAVLGTAGSCEQEGATIARGLRRRDPELLDRLIEQYQHRLLRYLMFLTGRQEVAEDLFQETWVRVLERGAQYNGRSRFDTWLFAIARHLVIDASRKKTTLSLEAFTEPDHGVPMEIAAAGPSPLEDTERRELAESLGRALARLDGVQREVVLLRFQEEMSLDEIAEITESPLSTVKSRLYRGLEAMRPVLEQERTKASGGAA
ncbi:MAG: RNA polymerase sigma factor [Acidobacteriales bacterium]|nr:RNA polymerase sigma factor [Terriglobales bacterium]